MVSPAQTVLTTQDLLTDQFYRWEVCGRGSAQWDRPVDLEPPFRPFIGHFISSGSIEDDGIQETPLRLLAGKLRGFFGGRTQRGGDGDEWMSEGEPDIALADEVRELVELQIRLPSDLNPAAQVFEQFLYAIPQCESPVAFELIGDDKELTFQVTVGAADERRVSAQFKAHFPDAILQVAERRLQDKWQSLEDGYKGVQEFGLLNEFMLPLNSQPVSVGEET